MKASEVDGDIPIIAITSSAMYGDRSKAPDAGRVRSISKSRSTPHLCGQNPSPPRAGEE
ncbi:MAG: hypothetical protein ABSA06_15430 [Geobacteraceae bacterium]